MDDQRSLSWQLVLETSSRTIVGLVKDGSLHEQLDLGVGRGQNRWLLPRIRELLNRAELVPGQLSKIVVSQGPGSYTGLRVGLTVAKTLAYALGCPCVAVPTFHAIAQELADVDSLVVVGDALNRTCYVQRFHRGVATTTLKIQSVDDILIKLQDADVLTGPGVSVFANELPSEQQPIDKSSPSMLALATVAASMVPMSQKELFDLEPLYLRGSSAEEKAKATTL